jgi:hypothetical protein
MSLERRIGGGRESLLFRNPEQADSFRQSYERRVEKEALPGVNRGREIMADHLVEVFEHEGVGITPVREPWEHSTAEHEEVQQLVEVAFTDGLEGAIHRAKESPHFPRNIDLLHDVLTGRLYEAVVTSRANSYHPSLKMFVGIFALFLMIIVAVIAFVYSL